MFRVGREGVGWEPKLGFPQLCADASPGHRGHISEILN